MTAALATTMPPPAPRAVATEPARAAETLLPAQRAAVILSLLPTDQARALADRLEGDGVQRVIDAYEAMRSLPRPATLAVVARFVAELRHADTTVRGGASQAAKLAAAIRKAEEAADPAPEEAKTLSSVAPGAAPEAVWAYLRGMPPEALASLLSAERPAVIGTVLSRLPEAGAGTLLAALPEDVAIRVVRYVAGGRQVAPETLDAIAEALRDRAAAGPAEAEETDGTAALTAILNRCPYSRQEAVLAPLRTEVPEVAEKIEAGLLRFGTLAERLPRAAAPILFREADQATLDKALRYGAEAVKEATEYLYANISQRLAEQIRERVAGVPLPSEEEGERAQAEVLGLLLKWAEDGRFALTE